MTANTPQQSALPQLYRFSDLKRLGYVDSYAQLRRMQRFHNFPLGRMLSANIRTWEANEVAGYYANRPVELKTISPQARRPGRERKEAAPAPATAAA
jgi:hypothetical protein